MGVGFAQIPFNLGSLLGPSRGLSLANSGLSGGGNGLQNLPEGADFAALLQLLPLAHTAPPDDTSSAAAPDLSATFEALSRLLEGAESRPLSPREIENLLNSESAPTENGEKGEVVAYLIVPQLPANPSEQEYSAPQPTEGETALIATVENPTDSGVSADYPITRPVSEFSVSRFGPTAPPTPEPILVLRLPLPEPIDEGLPRSTGATEGLDLFFTPINTSPLDGDSAILANPTVPFLDPSETEGIVVPGIRDLLAELGNQVAGPIQSNPFKPGDAPVIRVPLPAVLAETWVPRAEPSPESAIRTRPLQPSEGKTQVSARLVVGDIAEQLRALSGTIESIRTHTQSARALPVQVHAVVARATNLAASVEGVEPIPSWNASRRLGTYTEAAVFVESSPAQPVETRNGGLALSSSLPQTQPKGSPLPSVASPEVSVPPNAGALRTASPTLVTVPLPPESIVESSVSGLATTPLTAADPPAHPRLVVISEGSTEEQAPPTSPSGNLTASLAGAEGEPTTLSVPRSENIAKARASLPPESSSPESLAPVPRESEGDTDAPKSQSPTPQAVAADPIRHQVRESVGGPDRIALAPSREGVVTPGPTAVELGVADSEAAITPGRAESRAARVREARILDQVIHAARLQTQGGTSEIRIRLVPENLGEVHLRVTQTQEGLTAEFRAGIETTREVLSRHATQLQTLLGETGLRVEQVIVRATGSETSPDTGRQGPARDAWSRQSDSNPESPTQERGSRNPNQREHPSQEERNRERWDRYA